MSQLTIAQLNDRFRSTLIGGKVMLSAGIAALAESERWAVLQAVRQFDAFTPENDPYGEHDFGAVDYQGQRVFFKIDYYYDLNMECHSENPADPTITQRVLTIMWADEY